MMSRDCHYRIASVPQDVIGEAVLRKDGEWNHLYREYHETSSRHALPFPPPPAPPLPICTLCRVGMGPVG